METARHVNFDKYAEFVDAVTSDASKDFLSLSDRLVALGYVAQACMALEVTLDDVVARNVQKLLKRYPEGAFDVYFSENRAADDR